MTTRTAIVTPDYFLTMGIPLRLGRTFTAGDAAEPVVIVNEAFVRKLLPDRTPIGTRLYWQRTMGAHCRRDRG